MSARKFAIGQRVWEFDENRRVYEKDRRGHSTGGPIYASHFVERWVVGVEGRSYVVSHRDDGKFPWKVGFVAAEAGNGNRRLYSDADKEDAIWANHHRYRLVPLLQRADPATLRRVAAVLGYDAAAPASPGA